MKRGALVLILCLVFGLMFMSSFVSAIELSCTNGSEVSSDNGEIDTGDKKTVNGLGIGIISSDETAATGRLIADLIIGAGEISVSNNSASGSSIELLGTNYEITLVNASSDSANIKVGSDTGEITEMDSATIGSLIVFLSELTNGGVEGSTAKIILGAKKVSLSNKDAPHSKETVDGVQYVLELFSASDSGATITVSKCKNGDISIAGEESTADDGDDEESSDEPEVDNTPAIIDSKVGQLLENMTNLPVTVMIKDRNNESLNEKIVLDVITELGTNLILTDEGQRYFSGNITKEGFNLIKDDSNILSIQSALPDNQESEIQEENKPNIFARMWKWFKGIFS